AAVVHRAFPDAQVEGIRRFADRHGNLSYNLRLRDPTMEIVLRVYRREGAGQGPWKEAHVLRVVTPETGVPAPRHLLFDDSGSLVPEPVALHTRLPGGPLAAVLTRLDEGDQETVGYEMGRYLAKLHSIPLERFGEFFMDDPLSSASEKVYVLQRVQVWLESCAERALLESVAITALERLFARTDLLARPAACFVHGDFVVDNVAVEAGAGGYHVTGLLDFQRSQGWSPGWDAARLANQVFEDYPVLEKSFLDGYTDTAVLPADFWERLRLYRLASALADLSGAETEEIKLWQDRVLRLLG
ncbi:MAG: aminoglycoside phosphotransferase family protein, partial [Chloroflexota bacterium]|nr:aminoglycoside phosphotransferase family protein [Chloroflexota bacterium]